MKIGFIVTAHHSNVYRPDGGLFIERFCTTLNQSCKYEYNLYVIDNASEFNLNVSDNAYVIRIDDQTIEGITGAWNKGIYQAYVDNCDVIVNCNDDLWFNESINTFIESICSMPDENVIYGMLSNGIIAGPQKANGPTSGVLYCACTSAETVINGFCFAMTKEHYEKYRFLDNMYFNTNNKHNGGDGKWGGQEGQFIENSEKGLFGLIINECWLPHTKVRGWKQLKGQ
jgi:hypothetical protein